MISQLTEIYDTKSLIKYNHEKMWIFTKILSLRTIVNLFRPPAKPTGGYYVISHPAND